MGNVPVNKHKFLETLDANEPFDSVVGDGRITYVRRKDGVRIAVVHYHYADGLPPSYAVNGELILVGN